MRSVHDVAGEAGKGLIGDRYHGSRHRHVTVQSQEALNRAAEALGQEFPCSATRRNITVDAGEIPTQPGTRLSIGEVEVEVVRAATPCRLLDDGIGPGAEAALRGRAGSVCRLISSGTIRVGDPVEIVAPCPSH